MAHEKCCKRITFLLHMCTTGWPKTFKWPWLSKDPCITPCILVNQNCIWQTKSLFQSFSCLLTFCQNKLMPAKRLLALQIHMKSDMHIFLVIAIWMSEFWFWFPCIHLMNIVWELESSNFYVSRMAWKCLYSRVSSRLRNWMRKVKNEQNVKYSRVFHTHCDVPSSPKFNK